MAVAFSPIAIPPKLLVAFVPKDILEEYPPLVEFFPIAIPLLLTVPEPIATDSEALDFASAPIAMAFSAVASEVDPIVIAWVPVAFALIPIAVDSFPVAWASAPIANALVPVAFVLTPIAIEASPLAWVFLVKFPDPSFVAVDE